MTRTTRFTFVALVVLGVSFSIHAQDAGVGPTAVASTLRAAGKNAGSQAATVVVTAIQNLGPEATTKQIASIVYAAVRIAPDSALQIVRAAVKVSPDSAAPAIAAAAAQAVPNPWKEVRYQKAKDPNSVAPAQPAAAPAGPKVAGTVGTEPDFKTIVDSAFIEAVNSASCESNMCETTC